MVGVPCRSSKYSSCCIMNCICFSISEEPRLNNGRWSTVSKAIITLANILFLAVIILTRVPSVMLIISPKFSHHQCACFLEDQIGKYLSGGPLVVYERLVGCVCRKRSKLLSLCPKLVLSPSKHGLKRLSRFPP